MGSDCFSSWSLHAFTFIVYPCSGTRPSSDRRRLSTILKIFLCETTWPIKAKFRVKHPWEGGTEVCLNVPGHIFTKIAATPTYEKQNNFKNVLIQNPKSYDLDKDCINDAMGLALTCFMAMSIWSSMLLNGEHCYKGM